MRGQKNNATTWNVSWFAISNDTQITTKFPGRGCYARKGQTIDHTLPLPSPTAAPSHTPTFFMDEYTFYRPQVGWIESNIHRWSLCRSPSWHDNRMSTWLYDTSHWHNLNILIQNPPPSLRTQRSALIQLYARLDFSLNWLIYQKRKKMENCLKFIQNHQRRIPSLKFG